MSLTAAQISARDGKLTASRVACLMNGDDEALLNLWRLMIGDPEAHEEDLSGVWPVQLGSVTETLNLDWYERVTGHPVTRRGEVVIHPACDWAACTLDGWDATIPAPIEAKHVGGREALATVIARYQPQLHWQMICTETNRAVLSVVEGASAPILQTIERDADFSVELWGRAVAFMDCVVNLRPPVFLEPKAAPVKPERIVSMDGNNMWGSEAAVWLANKDAKKLAESAEKALKAMIEPDVACAHGNGVKINRDRAGRLSLREVA